MIHQSKLHQKRKSANPENHTGGFVKIPQYRNGRLEWDCSMVKAVQVQMRPATFKQQRSYLSRCSEDLVGWVRGSDLSPSSGAQLLLQGPCGRAKQLASGLIRCVFQRLPA